MAKFMSLQLFILASIFFSTPITTAAETDGIPTTSSVHSPPPLQDHAYPSSLFGPILANLGFHGFSSAAASLPNATKWRGPATVFAPTDSSLVTCPTCSVSALLQEHTVPGLFPHHYLRSLAFGTKVETLASGRCITITTSNVSDVFISGVKITRPDLYNDGFIAVHGLQGFISHLSPLSCDVERMTSLSFPHQSTPAPFFLMRSMLKDAIFRLSISGYGVVSLALRVKYLELLDLRAMTIFALDDAAIFSSAGHAYINTFRFHVVPNKLLMAADLENLPTGTSLPTMELGQKLFVTSAGVTGGLMEPLTINYVKIKRFDVLYNLKIVVHGLSLPFPHVNPAAAGNHGQVGRSGWTAGEGSDVTTRPEIRRVMAPPPVFVSTIDMEDHHGL
ncbi:hypothetical protein NMG60_11030666 [Bertholletia excelsa]